MPGESAPSSNSVVSAGTDPRKVEANGDPSKGGLLRSIIGAAMRQAGAFFSNKIQKQSQPLAI